MFPLLAFLAVLALSTACSSAPKEKGASPRTSTTKPGVTTSSSTSPKTTSTTSTTLPPPTRELNKVLLIGDSEMFDAAPFITEGFKAAGIEVNSQAFPGTSLLGVTDVTKTFPTVISEIHPDAVLLLYSGVYLPPFPKTADGRDILLATPEFWKAWGDSARQATRDLSAEGAAVYWILLPHNHITWEEHDTRLNDTYLSIPGARFVDWRRTSVSGPKGEPLDMAPIGVDGALAPVRGADGAHFSADASRTLAEVAVETLLRDFSAAS